MVSGQPAAKAPRCGTARDAPAPLQWQEGDARHMPAALQGQMQMPPLEVAPSLVLVSRGQRS